ncbi:MAG: dihydrofolate reductase family protein [Gemmatimonadaceae bacterium]
MRTVTYGAACSLDGFIAGRDGSLDWLHFSKDVHQIIGSFWKTIDTVVMGRATWEGTPQGDETTGQPPGDDATTGIETYVFSRTLTKVTGRGVRLVREDAGEFVRRLRERPGKGICVMGGGVLARSLFDAGLIDEVGLNIHPVLLGGGVPMFLPSPARVGLELAESRVIDGGCVIANYRVRLLAGA